MDCCDLPFSCYKMFVAELHRHETELMGDYLSTKIYISTSSPHFFVQRRQVVQWQYLDLELLPNAMIRHNIPSLMSTRLIYVYQGELSVSGTVIPNSTVASLEGDDIFEARAGNLECFSRFVTKVKTNVKMYIVCSKKIPHWVWYFYGIQSGGVCLMIRLYLFGWFFLRAKGTLTLWDDGRC